VIKCKYQYWPERSTTEVFNIFLAADRCIMCDRCQSFFKRKENGFL